MKVGNPLDIKTSPKFSLGEMAAVGVVKSVSERALARSKYVGNGTLRSGAIKLGLAGLAYMSTSRKSGVVGKVGAVTSTAWTVDGMEDLINAAVNYFGGSKGTPSDAQASRVI